jgi:oxaloacetate decarboxylase alpha subunit
LCYLEAVGLGVHTLHTAVPPLANGSSQPSIFNVANNLLLMGHAPHIDLGILAPVSERLTAIARMEGLPIGAPLEYDYAQTLHQIPGGVISNLVHQLAELRIQHRLDEVLEEVIVMQKELGYPIMITPYSQFVVTQAAINVATGERYKSIIDPIYLFAMGTYGEDSGYMWMDQNLKDRVLASPRARELANRPPVDQTMQQIQQNFGATGLSDEEFLLRYIMLGDEDLRAMRAAGPPKQFFNADMPLLTLLKEMDKQKHVRHIHLQRSGETLTLHRRTAS